MYDRLTRVPPMMLFLVVGALLFAVDSWRSARFSGEDQILITTARVDLLEQALRQRYGRQATSAELDAELQAFIDEELLYREALRLGLHQTDEVVRRRLAQSMAFIIEGRADLERPSESDLQALYAGEERESNALTRVSFQHVFFSSDRRKGQEPLQASQMLDDLESGAAAAAEIGDPFLLGQSVRAQSLQKVAESFGQDFADAIADVESGRWSGPFASKYGNHLVLVESTQEAGSRDFERQRDQLVKAWLVQRRREVRQEALQRLRQDIYIEVDGAPAPQVTQL